MKKCYIFGASLGLPEKLIKNTDDLIIAADAGIKYTQRLNINPDIILGDFDSLGFIPKGDNVKVFPKKKDDTDVMLAIKLGFQNGYNRFYIFGGTGNRLDHTLANIQAMSYVANNGGQAFLKGEDCVLTVIKNQTLNLKGLNNGYVSVYALDETAKGVSIKGLSYSGENIELTNTFPLGVSNEFIGKNVEISVEDGSLLIVWQGDENLLF